MPLAPQATATTPQPAVVGPRSPLGRCVPPASGHGRGARAEPIEKYDEKKDGGKGKAKAAKKTDPEKGRRNPFAFVWTYMAQVVAEMRKVIWPNRKQMVSYTSVVLVFLVFMVALIGVVDVGWAALVRGVFAGDWTLK